MPPVAMESQPRTSEHSPNAPRARLAETTLALLRARSVDATLRVLLDGTCAVTGARHAEAMLAGEGPGGPIHVGPAGASPLTWPEDVWSTDHPIRVPRADGVHGLLAVPLVRADGRRLGVLVAADARQADFEDRDLDAIIELAQIGAAALESAEQRDGAQAARAASIDRESRLRYAVGAAGLGIWDLDVAEGTWRIDSQCKALIGLP